MNARIKIDYDLCVGCKECVKICAFGALEWLDEMPLVTNPGSCGACLECERHCSMNAIKIIVS